MRTLATKSLAATVLILIICFARGTPAPATTTTVKPICPQGLSRSIPARSPSAITGSVFAARVAKTSDVEREGMIGDELMHGNVPGFLRHLKPVTLQGKTPAGDVVHIVICVAPDYLAIGSDSDFIRIPMGLRTALAVTERFGFVLPTKKMVDAIYDQAEIKLPPQPMPANEQMRTTAYYTTHNSRITEQSYEAGATLGALLAGQKKDLVVSSRLEQTPGRVAIYGWHLESGHPIQSLSLVHGARYADYSHGVRLVADVAYVDGAPRSIFAVLEDPELAGVLNDEGAVPSMDELVSNVITQDSPALQQFEPVVDDTAGLLLAGGLKAAGFSPAVHAPAAPAVTNASMILPAP
jgi:hypothetical protein